MTVISLQDFLFGSKSVCRTFFSEITDTAPAPLAPPKKSYGRLLKKYVASFFNNTSTYNFY